MKVLVLGASGMMGNVIATYLGEQGYDIETLSMNIPLTKDTHMLNLLDKNAFEDFLSSHSYDVVVNASGVLIEDSEKHKDVSTYLNSFLPHFLENKFKNTKTKLIHLSTDCVFSGHNGPYKEDSEYDGDLFYDRTKALGEIRNDKDLTFRMSTIGPEIQEDGVGLFNWFMKQTGTIQGYKGAIWSGVTTLELARGINEAIKQNLIGLYHLVPNESISKYDLLSLIREVFEKNDVTIEPKESETVIDKTLVNTREDFDFTVSDYKTMIIQLHQWVNDHKSMYKY